MGNSKKSNRKTGVNREVVEKEKSREIDLIKIKNQKVSKRIKHIPTLNSTEMSRRILNHQYSDSRSSNVL